MAEEKQFAIDNFLKEIQSRKEDRGYLARLRRGLSASTEDQSWGILASQQFAFDNPTKRKVWATIGGLAALLVDDNLLQTDGWANLGVVLRKIMNGEGKIGENREKAYETKLRRLLNCATSIELSEMVVGIVRMAQAKKVPVNCRQLYFDLNGWEDADRREKIRIRWTQDFYRDANKTQEIEAEVTK